MRFFESMPDGWQPKSLFDLGSVDRGRSRHRPRHEPSLYGGPYPFIQTGDIKSAEGRITEHSQTYSDLGLSQSRLWPDGTMCITIAANIAETAILTYPACFPDSVIGFIANPNKADLYFVEYAFRNLKKQIQGVAEDSGTVQDNINLEFLRHLQFPVPDSVDEQRAIGTILCALDDRIALNRKMNKVLEATARALFRSWFVNFDPVTALGEGREPFGMSNELARLFPSEFEDSAGWAIPKGWTIEPLDAVANFKNGLAMQKYPPNESGALPVVKIAELRENSTKGADVAAANLSSDVIIDDGDVIFSWSGTLMVRIWCGGRGALNQHLFKVTSNRFPKWFYYGWTLEHLSDFEDIADDKKTTMGHIKRHHLTDAKVAVPPSSLIQSADRIFSPLLDRYVLNCLQSRALSVVRDAILPSLISGELRLKEVERQVEAALR